MLSQPKIACFRLQAAAQPGQVQQVHPRCGIHVCMGSGICTNKSHVCMGSSICTNKSLTCCRRAQNFGCIPIHIHPCRFLGLVEHGYRYPISCAYVYDVVLIGSLWSQTCGAAQRQMPQCAMRWGMKSSPPWTWRWATRIFMCVAFIPVVMVSSAHVGKLGTPQLPWEEGNLQARVIFCDHATYISLLFLQLPGMGMPKEEDGAVDGEPCFQFSSQYQCFIMLCYGLWKGAVASFGTSLGRVRRTCDFLVFFLLWGFFFVPEVPLKGMTALQASTRTPTAALCAS